MNLKHLTEEQLERYSRHIILDEAGIKGQEKIIASSVLVIGAGGLGSSALLYLAAAGVGRLGICDGDLVDLSNIHRQVAHFTGDIGRDKVSSAAEKCAGINPALKIDKFKCRAGRDNIKEMIASYDIIIDATDNFPSKFLINDASVLFGKPYVHAGILGFDAQVMTFVPGGKGPCYRCVFPEMPPKGLVPTCREAGVFGPVPGLAGIIQALEALKYIMGRGELLTSGFLIIDALNMSFRKLKINKNPDCPLCGGAPGIKELQDYTGEYCGGE